MILSDVFLWLLMGHIVFDWLLQNDWMARNKSKDIVPLAVHSAIYGAGCIFLLELASIPWSLGTFAVLYTSHLCLDDYRFVRWFKRTIKGMSKEADDATLWLTICVDQCFHLLVLFGIALYVTK